MFYKNILNALVLFRVFSEERVAPGWNHPCVLCPSCIKKKNRNLKRRLICLKLYRTIYPAVHTCLHYIRTIYLHIKIKRVNLRLSRTFTFKCERFPISSVVAICFFITPLWIGDFGTEIKNPKRIVLGIFFVFFGKISFCEFAMLSKLGQNYKLRLVTFDLICKCLKLKIFTFWFFQLFFFINFENNFGI